jgi:hypothetical protein
VGGQEEAPLEGRAAEIAVELVATAETSYREACIRRHLWVTEKGDALWERMEEDRRVAEVAARAEVAAGRTHSRRLDRLEAQWNKCSGAH